MDSPFSDQSGHRQLFIPSSLLVSWYLQVPKETKAGRLF